MNMRAAGALLPFALFLLHDMAVDISCYTGAVGLARATCPCVDAAPDGYNDSESGLYIADLGPLSDLEGFDDCGAGSVWDMLSNARDRAIRTFIADADSMLARMHKPARKAWSGGIGRAENNGAVAIDEAHAGIRLACAPVRGAYARITSIGGYFDATGDVDVKVYDKHNTLRATRTITVTANKHTVTALTSPIELPLFDDYLDQAEYFFVYTLADAPGTAADNRFTCNCGGAFKGVFNCSSPYYNSTNHVPRYGMTYGWADWVMAGGWTGDTLTDFENVTTVAPNKCYGLTLFLEFSCRASEVLCDGELNFSGNPLAMSIAHALQYKAAEYMALDVLSSSRLNRGQLINREVLVQNQAFWRGKYNEHVNYIVTNADLSKNDCLTCRSVAQMAVQGVFA